MKDKIQVVTIDGAIDEIEFDKFKPAVKDRIKELELSLSEYRKENKSLKKKNDNSFRHIKMLFALCFILSLALYLK